MSPTPPIDAPQPLPFWPRPTPPRFMLVSDLDHTMVQNEDPRHAHLLALNAVWQLAAATAPPLAAVAAGASLEEAVAGGRPQPPPPAAAGAAAADGGGHGDCLLVYSTGRSPHLYRQLWEEAPLLTPHVLICSVGSEVFYLTPPPPPVCSSSSSAGGSSSSAPSATATATATQAATSTDATQQQEQQVWRYAPDPEWEAALDAGGGWDRGQVAALVTARFPQLLLQRPSEQRRHKVSYTLEGGGGGGGAPAAEALMERLQEELRAAGLNAKVVYSGGRDVDVLAAGAGKGGALAHLLRRLAGAGAAPTAGVQVNGDSGNDIELFQVHNLLTAGGGGGGVQQFSQQQAPGASGGAAAAAAAVPITGCVVANAHPELRKWAAERLGEAQAADVKAAEAAPADVEAAQQQPAAAANPAADGAEAADEAARKQQQGEAAGSSEAAGGEAVAAAAAAARRAIKRVEGAGGGSVRHAHACRIYMATQPCAGGILQALSAFGHLPTAAAAGLLPHPLAVGAAGGSNSSNSSDGGGGGGGGRAGAGIGSSSEVVLLPQLVRGLVEAGVWVDRLQLVAAPGMTAADEVWDISFQMFALQRSPAAATAGCGVGGSSSSSSGSAATPAQQQESLGPKRDLGSGREMRMRMRVAAAAAAHAATATAAPNAGAAPGQSCEEGSPAAGSSTILVGSGGSGSSSGCDGCSPAAARRFEVRVLGVRRLDVARGGDVVLPPVGTE
ncbi:hypothetical protein HXX76_010692 [Chlamydomonas incerta]|uniref:Sucrose phosphatase-like domain-containing protein n=1 Tax=Chlamydomonas incerta TaxID=51695 RepID=A0A835VUK8_CHLIN|nr:hypothetical protein HXX76_010692 [Chlamydomonas incerta]|eukprot:KAG2429912.1 hypothetical protein HXX76_010692 [Chlamydomonas incerta]